MRDLPDSADEKWWLTAHTATKHEILHRYLGAWLPILGSNPLLVLLDGFAGRGQYMGGEPGSPKIMFDRAVEVVEAGRAGRVFLRCAEPDAKNFAELTALCDTLKHADVAVGATQQEFSDAATALADWAEKQNRPPPIFVMADPFGFSGVPLSVVERLMRLPRLEILVTFMVRDMNRFLGAEHAEAALTEFFGGDSWRSCFEAANRTECLLLKYRERISPGIAEYATAFRVFEDARQQVVYYLVHLTNSPMGMRRMKEAMAKQSDDMTFWPVTVRSPEQLTLDVAESQPFPSLQKHLLDRYAGRELTFEELLNEDYPDGAWVESHYRWALVGLEKADPPAVSITRNRPTKSGRAPRGVQEPDVVKFL